LRRAAAEVPGYVENETGLAVVSLSGVADGLDLGRGRCRDERPSVTLVGGPAANALAGRESTDFASWNEVIGKDRYETAAMLASTVGNAHQSVALATGSAWPDALAGGAVAAAHNAPLLLSDGPTVPQSELAKISSLAYQAPNEILVFGGTAAVPNAAITALEAATGRTGWSLQVNRLMPPLP
jgi:putative cell wall-binding protein